jgi:hypothetical protein
MGLGAGFGPGSLSCFAHIYGRQGGLWRGMGNGGPQRSETFEEVNGFEWSVDWRAARPCFLVDGRP